VRAAFAHDAVLDMELGGDLAAPGGAVTLALCGAFAHPPPCPLAPHHTRSDRCGEDVAVRVLFVAEPAVAAAVRGRIDEALAGGICTAPDGARTRWTLRSSGPGIVTAEEGAHAGRLLSG
jgi:hypothetical protein